MLNVKSEDDNRKQNGNFQIKLDVGKEKID